jgi:hypothetical protein
MITETDTKETMPKLEMEAKKQNITTSIESESDPPITNSNSINSFDTNEQIHEMKQNEMKTNMKTETNENMNIHSNHISIDLNLQIRIAQRKANIALKQIEVEKHLLTIDELQFQRNASMQQFESQSNILSIPSMHSSNTNLKPMKMELSLTCSGSSIDSVIDLTEEQHECKVPGPNKKQKK